MGRRMLPWIGLVCAVLVIVGCGNRKTAGQAVSLDVGTTITVEKPIIIAELSSSPQSFVGQVVRLEGIVLNVCQGSGCWAEVQAADGSSFIAKSLDHSVLLPADCQGRKIIVQGTVTELSPEPDAAECEGHHAEGDTPHECPKPNYLVSMDGAQLH